MATKRGSPGRGDKGACALYYTSIILKESFL